MLYNISIRKKYICLANEYVLHTIMLSSNTSQYGDGDTHKNFSGKVIIINLLAWMCLHSKTCHS